MKHPIQRLAPFAVAFAAALLATPAVAQDDAAGRQKQLETARADLRDAARRVAELSRELGVDTDLQAIRLAGGDGLQSLRLSAVPFAGGGKPRLGVLLGADEQAGVRIAGVTPGSGADKAGLKSGDRLLRIKGKPIAGAGSEQRIANARQALSGLEPDKPVQLTYQRDGKQHEVSVNPGIGQPMVFARTLAGDGATAVLDVQDLAALKDMAPQLRGEVLRLSKSFDCAEGDCATPLLSEALRWNGLNLATVDPQLGRYFGTDRGVLVLSQGALPGLQAGDVIQKIEGKPVASPREAMQAMTAKKPGEQARVTVMRDRSARELQVTVPERMRSLEFIPVPPAPPAPPVPAVKPPAPPAPPAAATAAFL